MIAPPRVFVSAVSSEFGSARQTIKEALLTMGCHPVVQSNFPPDYRTVAAMLEEKIRSCQAVIHLVGFRYGSEPKSKLQPSEPTKQNQNQQVRRSYTQLEYDIARKLKKKVYVFVCPEEFPFDDAQHSEDEQKSALQQQHRLAVLASDTLRYEVDSTIALREKVKELQIELEELRQRQARSKRKILLGSVVLAVLLAGGSTFLWQTIGKNRDEVTTAIEELKATGPYKEIGKTASRQAEGIGNSS